MFLQMRNWVGVLFLIASPSWAWGLRGHSLVAHVSARLLTTANYDHRILKPFLMKEEMLGHLANIPDVGWKTLPAEETKILNPTHYFEVDHFTDKLDFSQIPQTIDAVLRHDRESCKDHGQASSCGSERSTLEILSKIGSAPWRTQEFADRMTQSLRRLSGHFSEADNIHVNRALDAAGLLSHFTADLANPHHASREFDGWETAQGGLHVYFETEVVDVLALSLIQEVYDYAVKEQPFTRKILPLLPKGHEKDPVAIVSALALESHEHLSELLQIDRSHARLAPSTMKPKVKARRKNPTEAAPFFKDLIVQRLAMAADVTAHVWYYCWEKAGQPDLSAYFDLSYTLNPEPVLPAYLFPVER